MTACQGDHEQGLLQPALPTEPQGGSHGCTPHRKPLGSCTAHLHTSEEKKQELTRSQQLPAQSTEMQNKYIFLLCSEELLQEWQLEVHSNDKEKWDP